MHDTIKAIHAIWCARNPFLTHGQHAKTQVHECGCQKLESLAFWLAMVSKHRLLETNVQEEYLTIRRQAKIATTVYSKGHESKLRSKDSSQ